MTAAGPIVALVAAELRLYRSVFRWLARRRDVPAGAVAAPYYGEVAPILWAFVGVSAVELVAVHLILPWRTVQIIADVLGIWGLVWMLSFTASFRVFPHLVTAAGLRIRHGIGTDIAVRWEDIATITVRARTRERSRAVQLDRTERDTALNIVIMSRTNVDITLHRPLTVPFRRGEVSVSVLRLFADDPRGLVSRVREHLTQEDGSATSSRPQGRPVPGP